MNSQAIPIKADGMEPKKMVQVSALASELIYATQKFLANEKMIGDEQSPDPIASDTEGALTINENQLLTLRLRTLKGEIIIAPDKDFTLITTQFPNHTEVKKKEEAAE
eukprot:CRZ01127.1 hypothetical protein [Spongospora subterranea]